MRGLASQPRRMKAPLSPIPVRPWGRCCICRRIAKSGATIACPDRRNRCKSRLSGTATIVSAQGCRCASIRTRHSLCSMGDAGWPATVQTACWPMQRSQMPPDRPANAIMGTCSPASRTLHAARGGALGPSLTLAPLAAMAASGRDGKTPLQPNQKTEVGHSRGRTYRALNRADILTRDRQLPGGGQVSGSCNQERSAATRLRHCRDCADGSGGSPSPS
jgi:hypothetical protein